MDNYYSINEMNENERKKIGKKNIFTFFCVFKYLLINYIILSSFYM